MAKRRLKKRQIEKPNQELLAVPSQPDHGNARVISGVIDWLLGGVVSGLPAVLIFAILSGKSKPVTSLYVYLSAGISRQVTIFTALLCLLFGLFYYVFVPWKIFPGQTVGKRMMHAKIVRRDGKPLTFGLLLARQFGFLVLIEGAATATSTYVKVFITLAARYYVDAYLTMFWFVLTLISMVLVFGNGKHLALHDRALGTMVVVEPKHN
ncbi:RDD family protein [Lacticaseibacillus zhaodongensis]|uniref:RDD family protein n=1 Tax=Lacticaseibacillus zhaodongensis TaxID=2668065 RepID=UPI0012D34E3B|nr:RDD family protein [Lacticaseibacillus zhaodongensis]